MFVGGFQQPERDAIHLRLRIHVRAIKRRKNNRMEPEDRSAKSSYASNYIY